MGKYNVGYHGPIVKKELDGIGTVTYDTLAIENVKRPEPKISEGRHLNMRYDKSGKLHIVK